MTLPVGLLYGSVFAGSLALTWLCMPLALRVARRYRILDRPGGYKAQDEAVPYLGGVVIALVFSVTVLAAAALAPQELPLDQLVIAIATGAGLALVGLADDLWGLSPLIRLLIESFAGLVVAASGAGVAVFDRPVLNVVLTVIWVVGITNALNLLDNMDGLSGGVSAIAAGTMFVVSLMHGQYLVAALSAALSGCALGFLRHNYHPAKIYMGDAGSLFIGFLLSVLGLKLRFDGPAEVTFFVPIVVMGVALFDTTLVVATRLMHRKNPFVGGRDHISHRLVFVGLPVRVAVTLIYGGAIALGWLAVLMTMVDRAAAFTLMAFIFLVAIFFGAMLGAVPVYDNSRRKHLMIREAAQHEHGRLS